ncbi:MAG: glycosyltransferase family 4 protein [Bacteroidota bacterium]
MDIEICHLTSVHRPDDIRIFLKECQSLHDAGYAVHLVHLADHPLQEVINGVRVTGIKRTSKSRLGRVFVDGVKLLNQVLKLKPDLVHMHDPELLRFVPRFKQAGIRVVFDAHEDLPLQVMGKHYIPQLIRKPVSKLVSALESRYTQKLDALVAATPSIMEKFARQGVRAVCVRNFPLTHELVSPASIPAGKRAHEICYIGGIMRSRGVITILDAIEHLPVRLHLCGFYSPAALRDELVQHPAWSKVIEHGFINREGVRSVLETCRIGMVTLHPQINYIESLPIKLFEYMSAGIPVIASDFPLWKTIIADAGCGLCTNPTDAAAVADAIHTLLEDDELCSRMGSNGQKAVQDRYNWGQESKGLIGLYAELLNQA